MTYSPNISYEQSQCNSVLILDKFITLALGITIFILCSIPVFSPRRYHHTLWITGVALSLSTIINYYLILPQVFRVVDQTQIILTPASSTPGI
jgi:hypothetical protein